MSKLNGSLYSSENHKWETPPDFVNALLTFEGRTAFDLDPACSRKNVPAHAHYVYPECDGLTASWDVGGTPGETLVYLNPPYGGELKKFLHKTCKEANEGVKIWVLCPARTETLYQHEYGLTKAGFSVFISQRIVFYEEGYPYMMPVKRKGVPTGKFVEGNAPFPAMLLYYGRDSEEKAHKWVKNPPIKGTLMRPVDTKTNYTVTYNII
jgi:hypothetical protein